MKEFEKTHSFEDVYRLKKEAALDREKQQHDKQQEKPKRVIFKLFSRNFK